MSHEQQVQTKTMRDENEPILIGRVCKERNSYNFASNHEIKTLAPKSIYFIHIEKYCLTLDEHLTVFTLIDSDTFISVATGATEIHIVSTPTRQLH